MHASCMPGTFSLQPQISDPDMPHGTCVTHVPWCMPGSLTSSFLWSRCWEKRFRHSRRMHNPQFYISGKRPMVPYIHILITNPVHYTDNRCRRQAVRLITRNAESRTNKPVIMLFVLIPDNILLKIGFFLVGNCEDIYLQCWGGSWLS